MTYVYVNSNHPETHHQLTKRRQGGKKGKGGKGGKALAYKPSYSVIREPLQARVMKNVFFLTEKVQGMASKGRKLTREMKEYFR